MPRRWRILGAPARTIRLRLTALYTTVYLVSGGVLLTIGYLLVHNNLRSRHTLRAALERHGLHPIIGGALGFPAGSAQAKLVHVVEQQITSSALHRLLLEYIGVLLLMTLISVVTGWLLAGRALAPLRAITATARRVSGENLGERIALAGPDDELRELADTFDGMLARRDGAFASQRHFVANASHELRTPLAIMRTEVDVALADPDATTAEGVQCFAVVGHAVVVGVPAQDAGEPASPLGDGLVAASHQLALERAEHRALRRRSQHDRMTWKRMRYLRNRWLPLPKIVHPWPDVRFDARTQGRSPVR